MSNVTEYLAEVKARAENATPGAWQAVSYKHHFDLSLRAADILQCSDTPSKKIVAMSFGDRVAITPEDADFIAHARTDVPRLVALVEADEAKIAAVLELHQPFEWSFGEGPVFSCRHCREQGADEAHAQWPCPTAAALGVEA